MPELPKRNVNRPDSSRPAQPLRSNDALNLDTARAALARAIAAQHAEGAEGAGAGRSTPAQGATEPEPGLRRSSAESKSTHEIPPSASSRRWAFLRQRRVLATAAAVAVVAVVMGVAVTVGGGSDSSGRRADAPAEGLVESDSEYEGAGGQSLLPGAPTVEQSAPPSVTPSVSPSSSSKSAQATPHPGRSTAAAGSGSSSAADDPGTDSAANPGSGNPSGSTTVTGVALSVQASGTCLTGAGSGAQLLASPCGGSAGQSWSPHPDGSLRQGGLCVTVTGTEDRTPVVLATCDRSSVQRISLSGTALVSASTGKCLDLFGGASGTQIVLWECNGRDNQHWSAA